MACCCAPPQQSTDKVETLAAPADCEAGERCFFGETSATTQAEPLSPNQVGHRCCALALSLRLARASVCCGSP